MSQYPNGVRVISERTLDNKTIKLTDDNEAIEVQVSDAENNAVKVKEDGIYVEQGFVPDLVITDLDGVPIGKIVSFKQG